MKLFLSWSGPQSHKVAIILRDWIPSVIQTVEPYVSSEDIDKGTRWSSDIAKELEASSYGILCVTKSNLNSTWLNFEAGALSKSIDKGRVSPFLFDLKRAEVKGPILQFQSTIFEKQDIYKLLQGLNSTSLDFPLEESRLQKVFEVWWPTLEEALNNLLKEKDPDEKVEVSTSNQKINQYQDILEEILELTRSQQRVLNSPEQLLPSKYLNTVLHRSSSEIHPEAIEELSMIWEEFVTVLSVRDDVALIELPLVNDYVHKLSRPIDHIIRRYLRKPRFSTGRITNWAASKENSD